MQTGQKYNFLPISDDLAEDATFLFNSAFKRPISTENMRQKYNTFWCGERHLCYLAYTPEGESVAFYGALPYKFEYKGQEMLVAQACDSITVPAHQKRGLHFQLANLSYEAMRKLGARLVFALHSETTFQHTKRLGWVSGEHLRRYHLKITTLPINKIFFKINAFFPIYERFVRWIWRTHIEPNAWFPNPLLAEGHFAVKYTPDFFKYKTHGGSFVFRVENTLVWAKIQGALVIGAIEKCDAKTVQKVMNTLKRWCFLVGITEILIMASPETELSASLEQLVPSQKAWLVGWLMFDEMQPDGAMMKFNYGDLDAF
jgi:hypothetical protein